MSEKLAINQIADALDAGLRAWIEYDEKRERRAGPRAGPLFKPAPDYLQSVVDDPAGAAFVLLFRDLGQKVHDNAGGNTDTMSKVIEHVAKRDARNSERRIDILDKAWTGIGGWQA